MVVVGAVIRNEGRILACQRSRDSRFPLKWEFPGGKVEPGETPRAALVRELKEELAIDAEIGEEILRTTHRYAEMPDDVRLIFFTARWIGGEIENRVFEAIEWAEPEKLVAMDFLAADRGLISKLALEKREPRLAQSE